MINQTVTSIIIGEQFCGPPGMGNGGIICGLLAQELPGTIQVTLRRPAPLERPLQLHRPEPNHHALWDDDTLIAEAEPATLALDVPEPPTFAAAQAASQHYGDDRHPFPACFVCGPQRDVGDGLRIFPALVPQRNLVAAPWLPAASLADKTGRVRPLFLWAALDCPGGIAATFENPRPILLGQLTAAIYKRPHIKEPCVVIGWHIQQSRRKHLSGTAVFGAERQLLAAAQAVWIEPR